MEKGEGRRENRERIVREREEERRREGEGKEEEDI
jgi:hypothetical protein